MDEVLGGERSRVMSLVGEVDLRLEKGRFDGTDFDISSFEQNGNGQRRRMG